MEPTLNGEAKPMRVGIVGMGPVGSTLTVFLKEAGAIVVPCDSSPGRIDAIRKDGIRLTHVFDKFVKVSHACYTIQELGMHDLDLIVIAVKTPDLSKALEQILEIDDGKLHVMCAQNGIDNEVEIGRKFSDHRTHRLVINYAGNMVDGSTVHASFFNPPNYVACLGDGGNQLVKRFADMLNSVGLETEIPVDIQDHVWSKAILNASVSAICAITRRTMKEVMDFPDSCDLAEALIDECVMVAEKERIELGNKFRRFSLRYLKNAGHHRPSMLVDLENGDPTEIDYLNARIVDYGRKHCVPTPLNQALTAMVHLLERSSRTAQHDALSRH